MKSLIYLIILLLLLFNSPLFAMQRFDIVTTEDMAQMLKDRAEGKIDFILVNTLDEIIFEHLSIPGSINLPWSRIDKTAHRLGNDKNKLIITY